MIIKLPKSLSNQIAAGEVVERPASVVKELVENSIDSGAKNIIIEIKNAGKESINIKDDGSGIEEDDFELVFERNATSKIKTIEDVYNIASLGFRGEALASIASVSKVVLISRHESSPLGTKVIYYGGEIKESQNLAFSKGTSITVSDIFYNTPARYKFLKSNASEKSKIMSVMTNMALSYPEIAFTVISNGKEEFRTSGKGDLKETVEILFEKDFAKALIPVEKEQNNIKVSGFLASPQYSRGNRAGQYIFVNGRIVTSKFLNRVIESAFDGMMMKRRYPAYIIKIDLPANMVDVNIHPQKLEVKFDREDIIESLLFNTLRNALVGRRISREANLNRISAAKNIEIKEELPLEESKNKVNFESAYENDNETKNEVNNIEEYKNTQEYIIDTGYKEYIQSEASELRDDFDFSTIDETESFETSEDVYFTEKEDKSIVDRGALKWSGGDINEKEDIKVDAESIEKQYLEEIIRKKRGYDEVYDEDINYDDFKIIGQVLKTFIVCECGTSVYYIDQHAAHERVLFERFYKAFQEKKVENQMLIEAMEYRASLSELDSIESAMDFLIELGVEIEKISDRDYLIKSLPVFGEMISKDEIVDIIDKYYLDKGKTYHKYFIDKIISHSCRSAIMSGDDLNHIQMQDLINMLKVCDNPHSCPHGRPTTIEMKRSDFDKLFKRIV